MPSLSKNPISVSFWPRDSEIDGDDHRVSGHFRAIALSASLFRAVLAEKLSRKEDALRKPLREEP
jgi:hypothetical protein